MERWVSSTNSCERIFWVGHYHHVLVGVVYCVVLGVQNCLATFLGWGRGLVKYLILSTKMPWESYIWRRVAIFWLVSCFVVGRTCMDLSFFYANRVKPNLFFWNYTAKKLHCKSWRNYLSTGAGFLPSTACPFPVGWFAIYIHHFKTAAYFA